MKISYGRFLSAFFALAAFAVASQAQATDQVVVNVPYEFVVGTKTLPAGTYTVRRTSSNNVAALSITSFENRAGVLLIATEVSPATEGNPTLSFQVEGNQHFLSKIETPDHTFIVPVSKKAEALVAGNKTASPSTSSSSGSN